MAERVAVLSAIGMPYGAAGAHWALLGPGRSVQLRRTELDLDAAVDRVTAGSGYEEAAEWARYFVRSEASDVDALRAFGPRDGRPVEAAPSEQVDSAE